MPSSILIKYRTHASTIQATGPPPFFLLATISVLGHVLVHFVNKAHALVLTVELILLLFWNMLSFNFVQTPKKSLTFRRFRRKSYINRSVVFLTNHCQRCTAFLLF